MERDFRDFERLARRSHQFATAQQETELHPFERRNVHPALPKVCRTLFDTSHYSQSALEAFKYVNNVVKAHCKSEEDGVKLMTAAFREVSPHISLTPRSTESEKNEQQGFMFLFMGGITAIRNPRAHEHAVVDDPDTCLDYLGLASTLLRRLHRANVNTFI